VNVLLGVIFKLFPKYNIDNLQAITVNYFVSFALGSILLGKLAIPDNFYATSWFPYALFLAVTFIIGFNVTALSFQKFGITFTTIIQKMSLIIPVSFAILYFKESSSPIRIVGILAAILAIILINLKSKDADLHLGELMKKYWFYPFFTFVMSGIVELMLLYMEKNDISGENDAEFVTMLFGLSGLLGILSIFTRYFTKKKTAFNKNNLIAGVLLGIPNYFTIFLLVMLLKNWDGSIVFPINNVGILAASALVAILFFKEKLNRNRQLGLALAILSIYLISQF
jgi:drug/metabolite transporter (DMT)-like permease